LTRLGWTGLKAAAPIAVALAAIWALASVAVARLSGRAALLSIPALAAFVLSIAAMVVIQTHHQRFLPFALANAALSAVLVRVAIQFDRRPRG
jgi:branched-subunit amino acid transport protein AzlD